MADNIKIRLLNFLLEKGILNKPDYEKLLADESLEGSSWEENIIKKGYITLAQYKSVLEDIWAVSWATEEDYPSEPILFDQISLTFMKAAKILPAKLEGHTLTVIMANPNDLHTLEALRLATSYEIKVLGGLEEEIQRGIDRLYGSGLISMEKIIEDIDRLPEYREEEEENVDQLRDMASEGPVIRLVNLIITKAIEQRASDIHFEPFEDHFRVRYRIDGVLHDVESPPKRLQAAIISRLKIMAKLNIAERRLPQDGRMMLRVKSKEIDFRVSSVPTIHGESVVLRILDKGSMVLEMGQLGFQTDTRKEIEELIQNPHGIILVTGPTGSGKTTTLYCALQKINSVEKKIITVEDPVEYQLPGINQIQVKPSIGLTFANALRSIVRQDPDIILIGEIRDAETAEIAIHSALTGHLVLSTLHTNDAPSAITRLIDMGMEDYLLSSTILGILAQRLVRVSCPFCRISYSPDPLILKEMKIEGVNLSSFQIHEVQGCVNCAHTGYRGRTGIFELLRVNEEIQKLILEKKDASTIKEVARNQGMRTLREDGWLKVKQGITTISEVLRVTQEESMV